AAARPGSVFISWAGVTCVEGPSSPHCTYTPSGHDNVIATFKLPTLRISFRGDGVGRLTFTNPIPGLSPISCSNTAACPPKSYPPGASVSVALLGPDGNVT